MQGSEGGGWIEKLEACTVDDGCEAKGRVVEICVRDEQELLER